MSNKQGRLRLAVQTAIRDENLDLYILALVATVFTVLGVTGLSDVKVLSSGVLALLAALALSQIRSRKQVQQIRQVQGRSSSILRREFPPEILTRRASASDILLVGLTMTRTVQGMRSDLPAILKSGGRVRVLVLDPTDESLMLTADRQRSHSMGTERLRQRILATLDDLTAARDINGGRLEIRVLSSIPSAGFNCLDVTKTSGLVCVQHYEFHPAGEATPIASFTINDTPWYRHFAEEAERLWQAGVEWPFTVKAMMARAPRPAFSEQFGPEVSEAMETADALLITGVARNNFLNSRFNKLEAQLRNGQEMRFLLVDPTSPAADVVAERYYAERSGDTARERIRASLRLLAELKRITQGDVEVRLTKHPLSAGLIAINPRAMNAAVNVEYYTFQAPGEPKFTVRPEDGKAYDSFLGEGEALWSSGEPYLID